MEVRGYVGNDSRAHICRNCPECPTDPDATSVMVETSAFDESRDCRICWDLFDEGRCQPTDSVMLGG